MEDKNQKDPFGFGELYARMIDEEKARRSSMTQEERNEEDAYNGLDELASVLTLLKDIPEYLDSLLANPLLDKESEGIIYRLYSGISDFWKTGSSYVESNLAHYIDEEEDIYG